MPKDVTSPHTLQPDELFKTQGFPCAHLSQETLRRIERARQRFNANRTTPIVITIAGADFHVVGVTFRKIGAGHA